MLFKKKTKERKKTILEKLLFKTYICPTTRGSNTTNRLTKYTLLEPLGAPLIEHLQLYGYITNDIKEFELNNKKNYTAKRFCYNEPNL